MAAPVYTEEPARIVMSEAMGEFISNVFGRNYDMKAGIKHYEVAPGDRVVFDFRTCAPDIGGIMEIGEWQGGEGPQPDAQTVLNNLVVTGRMEGGIYVVIFPYGW